MHEVAVIQSLFDHIGRYGESYRLRRVTRVVLRVGRDACVCEDSLRFAFEAVGRGTLAEGAELVIDFGPGRELDLQSIEGEQEEPGVEN